AVLDTNTLVASAHAPASASRAVVDGCLCGEVVAVVSPALRKEYEVILPRAVRAGGYEGTLRGLLERAEGREPARTPGVVPGDPGDDKLIALALAAGADAVVTNDRHLLALDPYGALRILRPVEFVRRWLAR